MEFSSIKGLGPAKQEALREAGITNVEALAGLDLRRNVAVEGITQEGLKGLKGRARQALQAEGRPIPKAPYRRGNAKPSARAAKQEPPMVTMSEKRPGFLRRLWARN